MADLHQTGNSSLKGGDDNNNSYGTVSSLLPGDTVHISPFKDMSQSDPYITNGSADSADKRCVVKWPSLPDGKEGGKKYKFASIACPEAKCSEIGIQIISEGGSAVDAMVAISLALGVCRSLSCGLGGGGFMVYYSRAERRSHVLDYRACAAGKAHSQMYEDSKLQQDIGGSSIAIPGEIAGLWEAHQRFGKVKWSRLFEPAIELAENGVILNRYVHGVLKPKYSSMTGEMRSLYTNPVTGHMKAVGDRISMPTLAETHRRIAEKGVDTFYRGSLRDDILADLNDIGDSILTKEDFEAYKVADREPLTSYIENGSFTLISAPPPSGGIILQHMLKILDGYNFTPNSVSPDMNKIDSTVTTYHRILEAWKFAYAARSNLGDDSFVDNTKLKAELLNKSHCDNIRHRINDSETCELSHYGLTTDDRLTTGTCQVSILLGNGDAVSFTTTINSPWGCKRMGKRTGIIFNNEMFDFALPHKPSWTDDAWTAPSNESNWIEPGKRPLSAMCPTIILDSKGEVQLVTGGSGGSKITTAACMTVINNLWLGKRLGEAVSQPRLHHQLLPNAIFYEPGFPQEYLDKLVERGHALALNTFPPVSDSVCRQKSNKSCCKIHQEEDGIYGVGDSRRMGKADGF